MSIAPVTAAALAAANPVHSSNSPGARLASATRKATFAVAGLLAEPEAWAMQLGAAALNFTGHSPFQYLNALRLWNYDFSGKNILDIGAGGSRFAQMLNRIYGKTGTVAVSLDFLPTRGKHTVRSDAQRTQFADRTFDLTTANMMAFLSQSFPLHLFEEALRITRGEIRFGYYFFKPYPPGVAYLRQHPAVERVVEHQVPVACMVKALRVVLKKSPPTDTELSAYYARYESDHGWAPWRTSVINQDPDLRIDPTSCTPDQLSQHVHALKRVAMSKQTIAPKTIGRVVEAVPQTTPTCRREIAEFLFWRFISNNKDGISGLLDALARFPSGELAELLDRWHDDFQASEAMLKVHEVARLLDLAATHAHAPEVVTRVRRLRETIASTGEVRNLMIHQAMLRGRGPRV